MTPEEATTWLAGGPWACDGGLASELEARGVELTDRLWSARLLLDDPEAVRAVHATYFGAGAVVATTASYQASRRGLAARGLSAADADAVLMRSVALARDAADASPPGGPRRVVAASVGPFGAVLADGSEYRGRYGVSQSELVDFHAERLAVLAASGADLLAVETIPDVVEVAAVAQVLRDTDTPAAWVSVACADEAHTAAGQPVEEVVDALAGVPAVVAVGVNCTAPSVVTGLLRRLRARTDLPLVAYPNAGRTWDAVERRWLDAGVAGFAEAAVREWVSAGAAVVGGCCGIGPSAVAQIAAVLSRLR